MTGGIRETLSWMHTWSGLVLGLLIVMFAVTGAGLLMRPELDNLVDRDLYTIPDCQSPSSLDSLAVIARRAHPTSPLYAVEVTRNSTTSVAFRFADYDYVYVDPCTRGILGIRNHYAGLFGTLDWLHRFKFLGYRGRVAGGLVNLTFMIVLIAGGLVLWWPQTRAAFKSAVKFRWKPPGPARTLSLHKIVGLYTALLMMVITLTALPLSFEPCRNLIGLMTNSPVDTPPPPPAPPRNLELRRKSLEYFWKLTLRGFPNAQWASLYIPPRGSTIMHVEALERGMPNENAKSHLYLNAETGEVLRRDGYATSIPTGRKVYLYFLALHSGLVGGLPYQLLLLAAVLGIPVQAYSGASSYLRRRFRRPARAMLRLKLVRKQIEAEDICSFEFADLRGRHLPPFSAGSHIDVNTPCGITRQYSLCNDPADTHHYMIGVLLRADSRGGSRSMHERLRVGDIVSASVPRNHFPLVHAAKRVLLIAGGIGVTPILCMAERLANIGADFAMHYCVRSPAQLAFSERIKRSTFADRVSIHVSSEGSRLDLPALLDAEARTTHIYLCGPRTLIDAAMQTAGELGWPEDCVHREYFAAGGRRDEDDTPFDVRIASTGLCVHVGAHETVVAALTKVGVEIPTSCAEGLCGTCITRVIDGEVLHRDMFLTPEERAKNDQFTPCCSRARGQLLVLDL